MQTDHPRCIFGLAEVAIDGFPDVGPQLFERVSLRVDGLSERRGEETGFRFVLVHFEDDFLHESKTSVNADGRHAF